MTENPYQSPQPNSSDGASPEVDSTPPQAKPRTGALVTLALGWNIPIITNFYLLFTGAISDRTSDLLMASWAATIPFFVLVFAYTPSIQRWLLTNPIDRSRRLAAWGVAGLWTVLSGCWLYSVLSGG